MINTLPNAWLALVMALHAFFWHAVLPQFEVITLDKDGAPAPVSAKPASRPVRIAGTRAYELSAAKPRAPSPEGSQDSATTPKRK